MNRCCICDKPINIGHNPLCKEHWEEYHSQINQPWLRYLISQELHERRYRRRAKSFLTLEQVSGII